MNVSEKNFFNFNLYNSAVGLGLNLSGQFSTPLDTGLNTFIGMTYYAISYCLKDHILNYSSKMLGYTSSLEDFPKNSRERVIFMAIHITDFAIKAFLTWGAIFASGIPIQTVPAILSLAISSLMINQKNWRVTPKDPKIHQVVNTGFTFANVAGCHQAKIELQEIVDFLKNPKKFQDAGIKFPKGFLLSGPPGTGKTLLAKALAGEAKRPFFYKAASEFDNQFVGSGANNIRELFKKAKQAAPSLIFIDEFDAIAGKRGDVENKHYKQTLLQLLTEMDGFDPEKNIIVIAATNRVDALDKAAIRTNRFDRKIVVDLPDSKDRLEILQLHSKQIKLNDQVNLEKLAVDTEGFSGSSLETIINEAALLAMRAGHPEINQQDIELAHHRVLHGIEGNSIEISTEEKRKSAIRKVGAVIVGHFIEHSRPIKKVTITSTIQQYLEQTQTNEKREIWNKQIPDEIAVLMSERAAEEIFLEDISSATTENQIQAKELAKRMVKEFSMQEDSLIDEDQKEFKADDNDAEKLEAKKVNAHVKAAFKKAKELIINHKSKAEQMIENLTKFGKLEKEEISAILEGA